MRYYFSLFVVFSVGALVLAVPTDKKPTTGVNKEDVKAGRIYWTLPKHLEPKDPGFHRKHLQWTHPVIAVSDVDAQDKVKVAQVSSRHTHWESVEPASNYADLKGLINVGPPKTVHVAHLKPASRRVNAVRPGRLQPLIDRINANCPADHQLASCAEPPGSAQGDTVHGRPEDDHSKQSSQESSSIKGSSSQVSRPGSPLKQSSHSPSQGSQLDGSKQGSPPSSPKQGSPPGSPKQSSHSSSEKSQLDGSKQGSPKQVSPPGNPKQSSHSSSQGSQLGGSKQVSRPGSPKQSSHSSSQGSQLGGSKQGSQPGSSDDWQVATGRRRNKARGSRNKQPSSSIPEK